ncbi:MAG: O-antigen ligase family protein [Bacteroidetes bacterium]|nr:O-antigen ligase family protein [Bacteroidota bacterium]
MPWKVDSTGISKTFYFAGAFFILACALLISLGNHFVLISSLCILVAAGYILSISNLNYSFYLLAILLPFSLKIALPLSDIDLGFPSEAWLFILLIALFALWIRKGFVSNEFLLHPVSILLLVYLFFCGISALNSSLFWISAKAISVKTVYILVFYFGINSVFKHTVNSVKLLFIAYSISMFLVSLYFLYNQSSYNWSKQTAAFAVNPFFSDHTIYSACLAFVLPFHVLQIFRLKKEQNAILLRLIHSCFSIVFLTALYFTFCRAAWISCVIALLLGIGIKLKLKPRFYLAAIGVAGLFAALNAEKLTNAFYENKSISTAATTSAIEQTQSITNITTDVSNAERLNRWSCAWRMFKDRPMLGFGPGTFQFQYLGYQLEDEITYISVFSPYNIPLGRGGSAHNEYLLLLTESGIFSLAAFLLLVILLLKKSLQLLLRCNNTENYNTCLYLLLGLVTYLIHGLFNNYLDTDKTAFLLFSSMALLVQLDLDFKSKIIVPN